MVLRPSLNKQSEEPAPRNGLPAWIRRLGVVGVLFFLIKGLLWLLVPLALFGWQWVKG